MKYLCIKGVPGQFFSKKFLGKSFTIMVKYDEIKSLKRDSLVDGFKTFSFDSYTVAGCKLMLTTFAGVRKTNTNYKQTKLVISKDGYLCFRYSRESFRPIGSPLSGNVVFRQYDDKKYVDVMICFLDKQDIEEATLDFSNDDSAQLYLESEMLETQK